MGTVGYMVIEGWSFLDALFMTVTTMATVGYREVQPLSQSGRVFTIILIIFGVGGIFVTIGIFTEFVIEWYLGDFFRRRMMENKIKSLKDHFIICGYGRVGRQIAQEFVKQKVPFVVVDHNPDSIARCAEDGYMYVKGNASDDEVLRDAGILRARGLLTATDSDADNIYVTLSARTIRPDLLIVARANKEDSEPRLRKAGADQVIYPYMIGGRRMATLALRPLVVDFIDMVLHGEEDMELVMEQVEISDSSHFVAKTIGDVEKLGVHALGIKKKGRRMIFNPPAEYQIELRDRLIVTGAREDVDKLAG